MTPRDAAARWARVWMESWARREPEPIVALYAADARVSIQPFRPRTAGAEGVRAYLEAVFAAERDVRPRFGAPIVSGDRAAVEWWAEMEEEGEAVTLAGVSVLRFDPDGLVVEQRDSWNRGQGRRPPDAGWGREVASTPS